MRGSKALGYASQLPFKVAWVIAQSCLIANRRFWKSLHGNFACKLWNNKLISILEKLQTHQIPGSSVRLTTSLDSNWWPENKKKKLIEFWPSSTSFAIKIAINKDNEPALAAIAELWCKALLGTWSPVIWQKIIFSRHISPIECPPTERSWWNLILWLANLIADRES